MPHRHIILFCSFLFLRLVLDFEFGDSRAEYFLPLLTEFSTAHNKIIVSDPHLKGKHGGVPIPELRIYFAHFPVEVVPVELREVFGDDLQEVPANLLELARIVIAVELKGTVHDPAVVECGYHQRM